MKDQKSNLDLLLPDSGEIDTRFMVSRGKTDIFIQCHMTSVITFIGVSFQRTTVLLSLLKQALFKPICEKPVENYLYSDQMVIEKDPNSALKFIFPLFADSTDSW